ncbi:MAG: 16S rRNA (uracil(1498)-N(3))-methyltransferase [Mangrovibacterium sp.]
MHLFYTPDISGLTYTLSEEESKHAVKVLRMKAGDRLQLIDGKGGFYEAIISDAQFKRCTMEVISKIDNFSLRKNYLHIAVAPTKNMDKLEWFLEKATEIGIDEITPILCDHSERKMLNNDRLEKIIISAMKQSYKAFLPKLNELTPFKTFLREDFEGGKFVAHCYEGQKELLKNVLHQQRNLILIGPEGDFSEEELKLALGEGFKAVSLGESRLRTETAALVACHTATLMLGD